MSATSPSSQTYELTILRAGKTTERIELTPEMTVSQLTELCRQRGLKLAAFEPEPAESSGRPEPCGRVLSDEERALYDKIASRIDWEEMQRRRNSDGPWYTTEEVLAHLRSLAAEQ